MVFPVIKVKREDGEHIVGTNSHDCLYIENNAIHYLNTQCMAGTSYPEESGMYFVAKEEGWNISGRPEVEFLTLEEITAVSPCGMAVQNARQTGLNGVGYELTRDGFHLDLGAGRLVAGLTFSKSILGLDIEKCTFKPDGVTDEMLENAIESALKAVENSIAK